jgi:hypothetical protein
MPTACGYTHDVSGDRFEDVAGEEWTCSREPAPGADRCAFHAPPEAVDDGVVRERLLEAVADERGSLRLIGARLGSVTLDYALLDGPSNHPLDLREATVTGDLSVRYATVDRPLRLDGATLSGRVDFEDTKLARRVDFGGATFEDGVSFRMADFESWLDLRDADFHGPAYARVARFRRGIFGVGATFRAAADFLNTHFDDVANFRRAEFRSGAVFNSSTFEGNAQFNEATFGAPAVRLPSASGNPGEIGETLAGVALSMNGATCRRDLRLPGATIHGDVVFTDCELGRELRCSGLTAGGDRAVVDCTGSATISGTVDGDGGRITYDLTDAELGQVDLAGDSSFDAFRFDATTFRGFDFGAYKRDLAGRDWRLHGDGTDGRAEGPTPERLENLYLRAKNGAKEIGENRVAAEFFIREMRYRRMGHWERAVRSDDLGTTARSLGRWLSNLTLRFTAGYGERPFRPVFSSVVLILLFAGVYAALDTPIQYSGLYGYVAFSTEGFVSLILGLPRVTGTVLSFLLAVEAFLGGFAIALFVFTLTRSISR